jgi:hypothetical protein
VKADELLLWLSARKQGSWAQFKGAAEELHTPEDDASREEPAETEEERGRDALPLYQRLRLHLERLGHVEFFAAGCEDGWRVAPPVLAVNQEKCGWTGILCGARSDRLLARLGGAAAGKAQVLTAAQDGSPLVYHLSASSRDSFAALAAETGIHVQVDAPLLILGSFPPVSARLLRRPQELPRGRDWRVDRFSVEKLSWSESCRDDALNAGAGVFRFQYLYQRQHFLCLHGVAFQMPGAVAKYALLHLRRRKVLAYDGPARTLTLPAVCQPPLLVERALVLYTGRLPSFDGQTKILTFGGIPPIAAQAAARLLCQEN